VTLSNGIAERAFSANTALANLVYLYQRQRNRNRHNKTAIAVLALKARSAIPLLSVNTVSVHVCQARWRWQFWCSTPMVQTLPVAGLSDNGEVNRAVGFSSINLAFCCCIAANHDDSQAAQQQKVFVPTRFDDFLQRGQRQSDMPQCSRHCPSFAPGDDCRMRNSGMSIAASVPAASPQTNLVVDLAHRVK